MRRVVFAILVLMIVLPAIPAGAQEGACSSGLPTRLVADRHASVVAGASVAVRVAPGFDSESMGEITQQFGSVYLMSGPECIDGTWWWQIAVGPYFEQWVPEAVDDEYVLEPYHFVPAPPEPMGVSMSEPVVSRPHVPLPAVQPAVNPAALDVPFCKWDWERFVRDMWFRAPDPLALRLPAAYAGDLPVPPVDLDQVHFVKDAGLSAGQLKLLAQNGFVVTPAEVAQFDDIYSYREDWPHSEGKGDFITTDALLHSLFLAYQNSLMFLETDALYGQLAAAVASAYQAAEAQVAETAGTPLEQPARDAAVYYAVALLLLGDGEAHYAPGFPAGTPVPSKVLAAAHRDILADAQPLADLARTAHGRESIPFLDDFEEDFSQYEARSYYAGNPLLEAYFRGAMWLGRITFLAAHDADTVRALLALRALTDAPGAYAQWAAVADTLTFLVGPVDDFGPQEYLPLAERAFGTGLPLAALTDKAKLAQFKEAIAALPGPRVNSIPLPIGIGADQIDAATRGFRLFGQRFTFDGYVMQQLIYPEVGTEQASRALPLGLDVAAVMGSDQAYVLNEKAGETKFAGYSDRVAALRDEVNGLSANEWLENLNGGWLWTLQPLLVRNAALVPPLMQTDAWRLKDISTALASWTELKHANLLYAKQPMGGLGAGGYPPPVTSISYVEPNPLVFARIAVVATTLDQGLQARGLFGETTGGLLSIHQALNGLAPLASRLAEIARKEIAGEEVTYEELYWMQEHFGSELISLRYGIEQWIESPPETVALVADVASNASAGVVLEEAVGNVDIIYVVVNGPDGLHLTRGGVYSYREFVNEIDQRMSDDEWRDALASGGAPARPAWTALYLSE